MNIKSGKRLFTLFFICIAYKISAQLTILPVFGDQPITENTWFVSKNGDSIQFDNIRFYISNIQYEVPNDIFGSAYFNATKKQCTAAQIAEFANLGDKDAIAAYMLAANALAQTLASVVKVLDVKNVVIGGGVTAAWPLMKQTFTQRFEADLISVLRSTIQIKISNANDKAGMLGAAMLSMES